MKMEKEVCDFWDKRYRKGGKSGKGSTGKWRKWKWTQIEKYLDIKETTILDIGCGLLEIRTVTGGRERLVSVISPLYLFFQKYFE